MGYRVNLYKDLIKSRRFTDAFKLCRFFYRINDEMVNDDAYSKLEKVIKDYNLSDLVNQSYDDDEIPYTLLREFNLTGYIPNRPSNDSPYIKYLDSEKSMSIRAVHGHKEVFDYFKSIDNEDFILSPKGNGWNYKSLYINGNLELSMTRGRRGNGFDVTSGIAKLAPHSISINNKQVIVYGEGLCDLSAVKKITRRDGTSFTSPRMAGGSLIQSGATNPDDWGYMHYYAFNADNIADTISESLDILKSEGFDTMPYIIISPKDIPNTLENFIPWFEDIMDNFYNICKDMDLCADGIVIDVNNKGFTGSESGQYSSRNIAVKYGYWSNKYYKGTVTDIIVEQKRVFASVVICIDPLITDDSCQARRITSYNIGILTELNIKKGGIVYFKRDSQAINIVCRGSELKEAMGLSYDETNSASFN